MLVSQLGCENDVGSLALRSYAHSRESDTIAGDASKIPRNVRDDLFNECFNDFIVNLYGEKNVIRIKPLNTTYTTLYLYTYTIDCRKNVSWMLS